jgi:hypothetical protein
VAAATCRSDASADGTATYGDFAVLRKKIGLRRNVWRRNTLRRVLARRRAHARARY